MPVANGVNQPPSGTNAHYGNVLASGGKGEKSRGKRRAMRNSKRK